MSASQKTNGEEPSTERLTLTVDEAAALLRISRCSAYEAVRRGEIPSVRMGRRVLIPTARLLALLGAGETKEVVSQ